MQVQTNGQNPRIKEGVYWFCFTKLNSAQALVHALFQAHSDSTGEEEVLFSGEAKTLILGAQNLCQIGTGAENFTIFLVTY
jgi:hypothetical protein